MDDNVVLELARAVRWHLPTLFGPSGIEQAKRTDAELAALLDRAAREPVARRIEAVLQRDDVIWQWVVGRLTELGGGADRVDRSPGGAQPPPAAGLALSASRHACPLGDFVFYQHSVGEPVPPCPTHDTPLQAQPWGLR